MRILLSLANWFIRLWNKLDRRLCCSLPGPVRFWWSRLWVRKDEFHPSLNSHAEYAVSLKPEKRTAYSHDLARRRGIAHVRDLEMN
jgi:hypothetical protein